MANLNKCVCGREPEEAKAEFSGDGKTIFYCYCRDNVNRDEHSVKMFVSEKPRCIAVTAWNKKVRDTKRFING